ncbi:MAG: sigma-54 dependent transcriptional regulator, partial [Calditrichota bacterium]
ETAVEAMKKGAKDYILKPLRFDEIVSKVETISELKSLMRENKYLHQQLKSTYAFDNIIGRDPKMLELFDMIRSISSTPSTVLIRGENGTGKELIAKAIHYHSDRMKKPMVTVNCGAIPEQLLESELFGHVKGAFTNAIKDKPGKFEMAHGGTIFLDEIGDINTSLQVKLLRAIQEREIERVGSNEVKKVDVRIISATNANLEEKLETGEFRQDLYYRLNVIQLDVPPLRERIDDIPLLISHFLAKYNKALKKNVQVITPEAMELMQSYNWQGNIRELENVVQRALTLDKSEIIRIQDLPKQMQNQTNGAVPGVRLTEGASLSDMVDDYEKCIIEKALETNNGNKSKTAKFLQTNRSTFMSNLSILDIN